MRPRPQSLYSTTLAIVIVVITAALFAGIMPLIGTLLF